MTIPDYQTVMLPLLRYLSDDKVHQKSQLVLELAKYFNLTPEEKRKLLASGREEVFNNRVGWARTYLIKAGLLKSISWGFMQITEKGKDLLRQNPAKIDLNTLSKYQEFQDFKGQRIDRREKSEPNIAPEATTPSDMLDKASIQLFSQLQKDLLNQLQIVSPERFEYIVVDVLVKMGYGGDYQNAKSAIVGGPGDEGIDGVINEDPLGLSKIYVQAKRWKNTPVNHKEIRNFIGAIDVKHADKGVFITTSYFTPDAEEATKLCSKRVVLIDGDNLAKIMINNDVGVVVEDTIKIRKLDRDYFE